MPANVRKWARIKKARKLGFYGLFGSFLSA